MIPVDQFARELCVTLEDSDRRYYNKIIGSMARGYRDINLSNAPSFKTVDVILNPLNMIDWPEDCIYPLYVGIGRGGVVINLSNQFGLTDRNAYQEANYTRQDGGFISTGIKGTYYPNYSGAYATSGELYGAISPLNPVGVYNNNRDIRQTSISGAILPTDTILLTYKYDTTSDGLQFIPTEMEVPLRAYVMYEFFMLKDKGLSASSKREYERQCYRLRGFYNNLTDSDWLDILTSNYKSSPK